MDDPIDRGIPFELNELWAPSAFSNAIAEQTLFQPLDFDIPLPDLKPEPENPLSEDVFTLPEIGVLGGLGAPESDASEITKSSFVTPETTVDETGDESQLDIWNIDVDLPAHQKVPQLRTWEAFEGRMVAENDTTPSLSEAGPAVFDAALAISPHGKNGQCVLPQDVSLRAFCSLALGRSSLFFQWDDISQCFTQTLSDIPVSGLSTHSSASIAAQLIKYGSQARQLYEYADASFVQTSCSTVTSLKQCTKNALDAIESELSESISKCESVLQLQRIVEAPAEIVTALRSLADATRGISNDEEAISILSDHVHTIAETGSSLTDLMSIILSRVCATWVDRLANDLGLSGCTTTYKLNDEPESDIEADLLPSSDEPKGPTPSFMDLEDRKCIDETRRSLKILRRHLPKDQLSMVTSVEARQSKFNDSIPGQSEKELTMDLDPWADVNGHDNYFETLLDRMSGSSETTNLSPDRGLHNSVIRAMGTPEADIPNPGLILDSMTRFDPINELRPTIYEQGARLNKTLLRYVFRSCDLRMHLDTQRSFQLMGNSDFITRFSVALFSSEVQSARRTRGVIPTSEIMGLRLGANDNQNWPPASSELRLTLADVLTEAYRKQDGRGQEDVELPGGLGFTIRELSDQEIERVMDPGSIYALDFLRLEYQPPSPLDAIMTASSMQKYDEIFRFMLKMLRLQYTVTRLRNASAGEHNSRNSTVAHFTIEAFHTVSALMTYFMDIGIDAVWNEFMRRLDTVENDMNKEDEETANVGLDYLRESHDTCLETIRERLFLKRKQLKLRDAVERVLTATLEAASAMNTEDMHDKASKSKEATTELVKLLQIAVDKPPKTRSLDEWMDSELEPLKMLLSNLNWNGFWLNEP